MLAKLLSVISTPPATVVTVTFATTGKPPVPSDPPGVVKLKVFASLAVHHAKLALANTASIVSDLDIRIKPPKLGHGRIPM
jgi:hypothetical protein